MEITEVRIKLMEDSDDRLQAFCSVTFDNAFVVRDLKIIDGVSGPFVAMPSRKLTAHCPGCGYKNHLRASYCNQCGSRLKEDRTHRDSDGRIKLYADIAHPINAACREQIQSRVIAEFRAELDRSQQPGYVSRYDDDYDAGDFEPEPDGATPPPIATTVPPAASNSTAPGNSPAAGNSTTSSSSTPSSNTSAPSNSTEPANSLASVSTVSAGNPAPSNSAPSVPAPKYVASSNISQRPDSAHSTPPTPPPFTPAFTPTIAPQVSAIEKSIETLVETRTDSSKTHRVDAPATKVAVSHTQRPPAARPASDTFGAGIFD
ncbi:MAG TPA: septation protein SpoVG family protein [Pirellulaceae bacterium]|nr:septation protein SpoVG family protein [Pirellulaceae bacterium]